MRNRNILFGAMTAAMTLLLILVLGETGARLFYRGALIPESPPEQHIYPYRLNPFIINLRPYLYCHIPRSHYYQKIHSDLIEYRINSMGFRGPEISPLPPAGKKRLLVLGDSIVEGHGVDFTETFTHLLGEKLADQNWEAINLGVQGASPLYLAANLERFLYLQPDAVLILLHENDLYEDEVREKSYFYLPLLGDRAGLYTGGRNHSAAAKSKLYSLLENAWHKLSPSPLEQIIAANAFKPSINSESESKISQFTVPTEKFAGRWTMSSAYLSYLIDAFRERGLPAMASSLCTVTLTRPDVKSFVSHCINLEEHALHWAQEHEVPFLSLVPAMQHALADHKITEVLIRNDYHPTPMTHELLADTLYPFVLGNLSGTGTGSVNLPVIDRE